LNDDVFTIIVIILILAGLSVSIIKRQIMKIYKELKEYKTEVNNIMKKTSVMFESISQRIVVLNNRLRNHFEQFGIKDIDCISSSRYIKNNNHKRKLHEKQKRV
jgi:predicted oxidoreductase (fatty acid repression mutant protein)